jgi:hypothetical protein
MDQELNFKFWATDFYISWQLLKLLSPAPIRLRQVSANLYKKKKIKLKKIFF